jgi:putative aldouronate transport system permease protein
VSFRVTKGIGLFDIVNSLLLLLISGACIFPFLYALSVSLTDEAVYVPFTFYLFPKKLSLYAYKYILTTVGFLYAFRNTFFVTFFGTILNLMVTFTMAYGLTRRTLPHRNILMGLVIFALVFDPGIIPSYLLVKQLGLLNSLWSLIIPLLTTAWSLIVVRSFLDTIPSELEDAARIDGMNDIGVFFRIIIPLSMACIATFTLLFAVVHWNVYFRALIYLSDINKQTLQVFVKVLVIDAQADRLGSMASAMDEVVLPSEVIRITAIMVSIAPILIVYPFLQRYFVRGVMLGSIKG